MIEPAANGADGSIYSLENTCRTCTSRIEEDDEMLPIFARNSDDNLIDIVQELNIIKLMISENDGLPQKLCGDCYERLTVINSFRLLCDESQEMLKNIFKNVSNLNLENLKSEDDSQCTFFEFVEYESNKLKDVEQVLQNAEIVTPEHEIGDTSDTITDGKDKECHGNLSEEEVNQLEASPQLECNVCHKKYKREAHLFRHMATHTTADLENVVNRKKNPMHVCQDCGKRFSKIVALDSHKAENKCLSNENPTCRFCKQLCKNAEELEEHLRVNHPKDRPHMCPICKKTFQSVSNRNTHLQSHNKDGSFICDICNQGFKSKVYLNKHKKSVHTVADHKCPHCDMNFDNTVKFEYHLKSHDPNKKYKCQYCDKSFLQHHHLANHERIHTNVRPYLCNICGKDFKQECNFKLHLRIHENLRPYICNICGKDFIQRGSFVMHMRQHAGVRPYQCEHCGKNFIQKSGLTVHLRVHTGERPYICSTCDKSFAQAQQLKYHNFSAHGVGSPPTAKAVKESGSVDVEVKDNTIKEEQFDISSSSSNSNSKIDKQSSKINKRVKPETRVLPYICQVCNKGFKLPCSLSSHMKVHQEERKFVCDQCSSAFKRAEHLRIHIRGVHLKEKPFSCDFCNKKFSQSGDRNIHMRRHTGERPHACSYCKKTFRLPKALRAHMRLHTGEKIYNCEFCSLDFMTHTALQAHTLKHEKGVVPIDNVKLNSTI